MSRYIKEKNSKKQMQRLRDRKIVAKDATNPPLTNAAKSRRYRDCRRNAPANSTSDCYLEISTASDEAGPSTSVMQSCNEDYDMGLLIPTNKTRNASMRVERDTMTLQDNSASIKMAINKPPEMSTEIIIKREIDINIEVEDHSLDLQIKTENVTSNNEKISLNEEINIENNDHQYDNIPMELKQEVDFELIPEKEIADETAEPLEDIKVETRQADEETENRIVAITKTENIDFENGRVEVKQEILMEDDSLVSYDYPDFNDAGSMDSGDAAVLGNVETCLQVDGGSNCESIDTYDDNQQIKEEYDKVHVKLEQELTVTETHLISNKVINTTSTVTNPQDGLVKSQTTKTLVMEILPMSHSGNVTLSKIGNPEQILPTSYDDNNDCSYEDTFQLNSITGNVLSLEQEAYGLLKAKHKKDQGERQFYCPKCPNVYKLPASLKRHLTVHDTIDKRAMGFIKGVKTRKRNRNKKLKIETDECDDKNDVNTVEGVVKKEGYNCTCGKVFQRRSRMETCLRSHNIFSDTDTCFSCMTCTKNFKDKEELTAHRKRLHNRKRFPCKFCPTDYNTRKELFKHLQVHQKVQLMEYKVISEIVKGKQKLRCFMCSKTCTELSELKSHVMDDHKEPYKCPHCRGTFSKIIDFGNHTKTSHPEVEGQSVLDVLEAFSKLVQAWKCEECELQFHEADKLALHQIEKHSPDLKAEYQFQCTDCRRVFITQKGLTSHRRVHHNNESAEEAEAVEKGIMCLECRKICKDMNALTSHMRFHSPDRKYPCKFCDFRFATPEKRKAHADIHTGDMKFVCFICEYQCSSENRLKLHKMSVKHLNMKEYLLTGKTLIEEEQSTSKETTKDTKKKDWVEKKRKKEKRLASDSDSEATCDICGDKFSSESTMLEHKQTHPFIEFPNDDKPSRIFFK